MNYVEDSVKVYGRERADRLEATLCRAITVGKQRIASGCSYEDTARTIELWDELPDGDLKDLVAGLITRLMVSAKLMRVIRLGGGDAQHAKNPS